MKREDGAVKVTGGPWPERIGCTGRIVIGPDRYPWARCGELLECLFEGGSATVDPSGKLVLASADLIAQMNPDA